MFSCKLNVMHKNAKYSPLLLLLVSFDHLLVCAGAGLLQCKTRWVCASNSLDSVQLSPLLPLSLYLSLPLHLTFTLSVNKLKNYYRVSNCTFFQKSFVSVLHFNVPSSVIAFSMMFLPQWSSSFLNFSFLLLPLLQSFFLFLSSLCFITFEIAEILLSRDVTALQNPF